MRPSPRIDDRRAPVDRAARRAPRRRASARAVVGVVREAHHARRRRRARARPSGGSSSKRRGGLGELADEDERARAREELLRGVHELEHEERRRAHRVGDVAEHDEPRLVAAAAPPRGLEGDAAGREAPPQGPVRIDAARDAPAAGARARRRGGARPRPRTARRTSVALGLGEAGEGERLARAGAGRLRAPARRAASVRSTCIRIRLRARVELLGDRGGEGVAALVAERLAERARPMRRSALAARGELDLRSSPAARRSRPGAGSSWARARAPCPRRGGGGRARPRLPTSAGERGRVAARRRCARRRRRAGRGARRARRRRSPRARRRLQRSPAWARSRREERVEAARNALAIGAALHDDGARAPSRSAPRSAKPTSSTTRTASMACAVETAKPSRRSAQSSSSRTRSTARASPSAGRARRGARCIARSISRWRPGSKPTHDLADDALLVDEEQRRQRRSRRTRRRVPPLRVGRDGVASCPIACALCGRRPRTGSSVKPMTAEALRAVRDCHCESCGAIIRHGPHQEAQKSTSSDLAAQRCRRSRGASRRRRTPPFHAGREGADLVEAEHLLRAGEGDERRRDVALGAGVADASAAARCPGRRWRRAR